MLAAEVYREGRERLLALAAEVTDEKAATTVPACPEWTVKDVYAHLAGVAADALAGRLEGAATDPWTARQVRERADRSLREVCDEWAAAAPILEAALAELGDAVDSRLLIDVWTHEQDVRGALGRPGARDVPVVAFALAGLADRLRAHWVEDGLPPIMIVSDTGTYTLGAGEPSATLRASDFELVRLLLGRRTVEQVAALDWTGDPSPVLHHLHVFGPARHPVVE